MKTCIFLIIATSFQLCSGCCLEFHNETRVNFGYPELPRHVVSVVNCTIVCTNIRSIGDIMYQYQEEEYDQFLKITDANVTRLDPKNFLKFLSIKKLYLSGIQIRKILPEAFSGLLELKELYLDRNQLTEISKDVFASLGELVLLDLSHNNIQRIENFAFMGMFSLQNLSLQENKLSYVDEYAFSLLERLAYLDLSENSIEKLKLNGLPNLEYLYLDKTSLKELPGMSNTSMNLKLLNMSLCRLANVDFSKFPEAETVDLSHNDIVSLQNYQNNSAKNLYLQNNKIKFTSGFYKLSKLSLSSNELESINQTLFANSQSILLIDLSVNRISIIESNALKNLSSLVELDLGTNNISNLETGLFADLVNLEILNLSFNRIEKIQFGVFGKMKSLEYLDISHNNILELHPFNFFHLSNLTYLDIAYNRISSFDTKHLVTHLPSIASVSLAGNSWKCRQLAQMNKMLGDKSRIIKEGDSYDVENVKGVACQHEDYLENGNVSAKGLYKVFQKLIKDTVKNSQFKQFLNEDFKNLEFFKEKDGPELSSRDQGFNSGNDVSESESGNIGVLILGLILQIAMCFLLIFIGYMMLGVLKKLNQGNQNPTFSQAELYPTET